MRTTVTLDRDFAHDFSGVLSVECGSPEQAERSLSHLNALIGGAQAAGA